LIQVSLLEGDKKIAQLSPLIIMLDYRTSEIDKPAIKNHL